MGKVLSAEELKKLPVGTVVRLNRDNYWMSTKYRVVELHGLKCLCGVHTGRLLTIKPRPKNKIYYELL